MDTANGENRILSGWGRTPASSTHLHHPRSVTDVEKILSKPHSRGVLARGLGRSYGDAPVNAGGETLEMTAMAAIRELNLKAGTVTVEAGVSLDALMRALLPFGWFVAVTPGTRFVTVGGAIASDIHGKNHHKDGGFCNHVLSFILLTSSGERLTVEPAVNGEVFWATAGGMGLTGIIVEATLELIRVQTSYISVDTERADHLEDLMQRMESGDASYRYSVAWIDCLATGRSLGRGVLTRGDHAGVEELSARQRGRPLEFAPRSLMTVPDWMPPLLSRISVRAFNEVWFRKAPRSEAGRPLPLGAFFHPLDGLNHWNRLYGRNGFVQYQFVLPFGAEAALIKIVSGISDARCPSFLAVLKRFGAEQGLLSFPMPGWTLALDIPSTLPGLGPLLDGFDRLVAENGGRVYLAKDSRMDPELFAAMYPKLGEWQRVRDQLDPAGVMRSDLSRRLRLT